MRTRRFWTEGAGSFVVAVCVALVIRWAFFEAYVIPSPSMLPTLYINDHIFVNKIVFGLRVPFTERWLTQFSHPDRGDVIVFKHPKDRHLFYIKRVVGLPGDRIYYESGNLYVNDQLVEKTVPQDLVGDWQWVRDEDFPGEAGQGGHENYSHWQETLGAHSYSILLRKGERPATNFGPFTVPMNKYFVMGDNRDNSQDSRDWDPEARRAQGMVVFSRLEPGPPIQIPAGTIVKVERPGGWSQRFRLSQDVNLKNEVTNGEVESLEPGESGNVAAGQVTVIEGSLAEQVRVQNPAPFAGGVDRRFVPRDLIVGRASLVWLSCEKKLPVFTFLCHPLHIRWSRLFHKIR